MTNGCARASVAALAILFGLALPAASVVIEDFEDDGTGSRYLVGGGAGGGDDFWGLQSIGNDFGFSGQHGADFFAGRDLDGAFGGGASPGDPRDVTVPIGGFPLASGAVDQARILLAANFGGMWDAGQDFLRIYAVDADSVLADVLLDEYLPNGAGNLESTTYAGLVLDTTFQDVAYGLPAGITNLQIRVEAYSTGDLEYLGFDFIRAVPEPATGALLAWGLVALAARRR